MADRLARQMTADEFLLWNLEQDQKYELVDGIPVPMRGMAGASNTHDAITTNLIGNLFAQLQGHACQPRTSDTAIRTAIRKVRRADVVIECAPPERTSYEATNPAAVFEILSPSTRKNDRSQKLQEYMRHPALRTIVHVDPDVMDVLVYTRDAGGAWIESRLIAPEDMVTVPDLPVRLTLASIYAGVPLQSAPPPSET
jgi:Uma2 family endonuclease